MTRHALLRALHPDGYRDVRALREGEPPKSFSFHASNFAGVDDFANLHQDRDVYVGVAPRANAKGRDTDACHTLHALFADQDYKDSSEAEARARLAAFPLAPSAVVASGGGLQDYWLLREPLDLQNGGADHAKQLLRALAAALGADLNAAEPARILRLPGTLNHKYDPARLVVVEGLSESRRYSLKEFLAVLPALPKERPLPDTTPIAHGLSSESRTQMARTWLERQPAGYEQGYRPDDNKQAGDSETIKVCFVVVNDYDLNEADAFETLRDWNARCDPPWPEDALRAKVHGAAKYAKGARGAKLVQFPYTEAGDAEHFAALYAGRVCSDARRSRWLLIEDESGLWLPDPVERLRGYAVDAMRARQRQANTINDLEKRKAAWNWAFKGESTSRLTNLLREARTQPAIRNDSVVDPWDADLFLLGVPGGVVDLRTGEKRKARPEERITMRAGADYDPSARSMLWESALRQISDEDDEWVSYVQRLGGYTTTGDASQDKWFIKHGKNGREGKGTIDGAWAGALGDYVLELPSAVFELRPKGNPDFDLSYLPNKRFVLSSESGNTVHLHHDRIKQMTGGGSMRVANKHEKSFEFVPSCKLWLACNDLPTVTDDSAAFWARVIVIPFRRSFLGKEDATLRPALSNDSAHRRAVLAWLVKGAIDYCRDGLGDMPKSVKDATAAFRDVAWPLTPLVTEDCIVAADARVSVGDFNLAYQRFCDRQGVPKEKRLGWKRVLKLMEARYETVNVDERIEGGDGRVREKRYVGIRLREPIAEEPVTFKPPDGLEM